MLWSASIRSRSDAPSISISADDLWKSLSPEFMAIFDRVGFRPPPAPGLMRIPFSRERDSEFLVFGRGRAALEVTEIRRYAAGPAWFVG